MWSAQSSRVTVFWSTDAPLPKWADVGGAAPDARKERLEAKVAEELGQFNGGVLYLTNSIGRSDWNLVPATPQPAIGTLGPYPAAVDRFYAAVRGWLAQQPRKTIRIAYGLTVERSVEDKKSGYALMGTLLTSLRIDPDRMSDLVYRVNWPCTSGLDRALAVNRILTCTTQARKVVTVVGDRQVQGPTLFAVRLELDINTSADNAATLQDCAKQLDELRAFAVDIVEHGEPNARRN